MIGVVGRDGGYTKQVADACVVVPTVNPATVTPHTEAFQAVVWHGMVTPSQADRERDEVGIGAMSRPAIFLDRDGVLVEEIFYPHTGEREAPLIRRGCPAAAGRCGGAAEACGRRLCAGRDLQPGRLCQGQDDAARAVAGARKIRGAAGRARRQPRRLLLFLWPSGRHRAAFQRPVARPQTRPLQYLIAAAQLDLDLRGPG